MVPAPKVVVRPQGVEHRAESGEVGRLDPVLPGGPQVADLDVELFEGEVAPGAFEGRGQVGDAVGVERGVRPPAGRPELRARLQLLVGEIPDRLQHREPVGSAGGDTSDETLVDERGEDVDDVELVTDAGDHRLDGVDAGTREDRHHIEQPPFLLGEQVIAPLDRPPQCPLPFRQIAGTSAEDVELAAETVAEVVGCEDGESGRRQLDCQRHAFQAGNYLGDDRRVGLGQGEARQHRAGPLGEESNRLGIFDLLEGCGRIWDRQWWDREHLLAAYPQRLSARHQGDQAGTVLEQLGDPGGGLGHLLEVVEDQQPLAVTELCLEDLKGGSLAGAGQVHLPGDRLERTVGLTLRRQVDEEDAVPVPLYQVGTHLQGEPGLAGPSWPGQRDQPCPRLGHH